MGLRIMRNARYPLKYWARRLYFDQKRILVRWKCSVIFLSGDFFKLPLLGLKIKHTRYICLLYVDCHASFRKVGGLQIQ
jgi:hypothetical protein